MMCVCREISKTLNKFTVFWSNGVSVLHNFCASFVEEEKGANVSNVSGGYIRTDSVLRIYSMSKMGKFIRSDEERASFHI